MIFVKVSLVVKPFMEVSISFLGSCDSDEIAV